MAVTAEFSLLGPLVVRIDSTPMAVPAGKHRVVLAALLLRANRVVPVEDLAEALWGDELPSEARTGVQNYVMRLRKALGPAGSRITTQPRGYLIRVEAGELDLQSFEKLLREARAAARAASWPDAAGQAAAALALWRGEPLADVGSDLLTAREAPRLAELRLQAHETRIDADLQLGRPGEVIGELRQLTAENPLRERFHGLLMLALYRDSRQGEALAAYQHARDLLIDQLGTEPGPDLQRLHQQILTADPGLVLTSVGPATPTAPVPHELPGDVAAFTGRKAELAELDQLLLRPAGQQGEAKPTAAIISTVSGTAGVGKTALAVHWAHHAAREFPDGQLYVNLRGYDPDQPMPATDALAGFLRSLGVPGKGVPPEETERAARYRSLLAGKRTLVVLDNAATVDQVRPLLPGHSACAVVVTSRDSLAGLIARDGAKRLDLDLLPLADAVALLRELIGGRVDAETDAATALAEQCVRLPLALRIAAELASTRPDVPLAELVAEVSDHQERLDLLSADSDPHAAVRAVFSWSYNYLDEDAARAFRLVGLHPGADLDTYAIAALTDSTIDQARKRLGALIRGHLIQATAPGRYGTHDLLGAYARELAAQHEGEEATRTALAGLFDYYLSASAAATAILYPAKARRRPPIPPTAATLPAMPSEADARAWLDRERVNLVAVVVHCADRGWPSHATRLARTLASYLLIGSHLAEAHTIYSYARQAARRSGDLAAEANALSGLGGIGIMNGHFRDAADCYRAAIEHYRQSADHAALAVDLYNLGVIEIHLHDPRSAAGYFREAIALHENTDDSGSKALALTSLAAAETELGSYDQAAEHLQQALPLHRDANDQRGEAYAITGIGDLYLHRGQLPQATAMYRQAMAIFRRIDFRGGVAMEISNLGDVSLRQGDYREAISHFRQALAIHRQTGYQHGETKALRNLAKALNAADQPSAARAELAKALQLASETGNTYQQASAHRDLADNYHSVGEDEQAREHWQRALALYTGLGEPEADEVREQLDALDSDERSRT
jgi:DNA-binding SARP family transcriptional activator/tetratricopeptide (TPR) repeat protein